MEKRIIPKFASEAEEAKWWFDNQEELDKDFAQAFAEGRLRRRTEPRPAGASLPTTTIRLDPADIELARVQAEKKGLKYQTYLKMVIHEALLKEAEASKASMEHAAAG
jgi:predicted DNA binding CopG/RHH family protein